MAMFNLTEDPKGKFLSIFYSDGGSDTIPETHLSFQAIIEKLLSGSNDDEEIRTLANVFETINTKMSALSERVSVDNKTVYFDGDPLAGELSEIIRAMFQEGRSLDFKPLVNFLEKAHTNPSLKSVDELYRWIKNGDLVIDHEGDIIAYKTVKVDKNGKGVSIHQGTAFVNGESFTGNIPNVPGTVITMPRSTVDPNAFVDCSTGLHAGTYDYAQKFAKWNSSETTRLVLVKINPRDVVSVPHDEGSAKMRVARYTVLHETEERQPTSFYSNDLSVENDYEEDEEWDETDCEYWDDEEDEDGEEEEETPEPVTEVKLSESAKFFTEVLNRKYPKVEEPEEEPVKRDSSGRRI